MTDMKKNVEALLTFAATANNADSAMKFSQAACNAANALCSLAAYEAEVQRAQAETKAA